LTYCVTYPSIINFMPSSKKYTLWDLKSNRKPLENAITKTEFVWHEIFKSRWPIHRSEILCWAQKSIRYGVWNATGSHEPKNVKLTKKFMADLGPANFLNCSDQWPSGVNRKSSCGYATHFFLAKPLKKLCSKFSF
jgi:hypothetical protein